jgi:hypothetical protein
MDKTKEINIKKIGGGALHPSSDQDVGNGDTCCPPLCMAQFFQAFFGFFLM